MLIKISLILVLAAVIAFLIIKFLPLKLRFLVSIVCLVCSVYLGYLIYSTITMPIHFEKEKKVRYQKVINKLKLIRDVQDKYRDYAGKFSDNEDTLVNFVQKGKLYITQILNVKKEIKIGQLTKEISVTKIDTIGTELVSKYFEGRDVDNLFSVPDLTDKVKGLKFEVKAMSLEKTGGLITGTTIEVFEARVPKNKILSDLDPNEMRKECWRVQNSEVKGAFVSVGDTVKISSKGNWPKSYDAADILRKKAEKAKLEKLQNLARDKEQKENLENTVQESDSLTDGKSEAEKK